MKASESLQEDWVKFRRIYCKEGFIDYWMGDCINNPNNTIKSNLQLNTIVSYFRLNGAGDWKHRRDFNGDISGDLFTEAHTIFSAEEIWKSAQ